MSSRRACKVHSIRASLYTLTDSLPVHRNATKSSANGLTIFQALVRSPQPIQSLYRGLTPNLIGNASSWGIFFYFKSVFERQLLLFHDEHIRTSHDASQKSPIPRPLSPLDYFLASGTAGIMITITTNPVWVLKTRMLSSDRGAAGAYPSMWQGARHIWGHEGPRGFYKGIGVSLLGNTHGAVQFAVYEPLKNIWRKYYLVGTGLSKTQKGEKLGTSATLVLSGSAKIVAGTVTYPYQVIRSRLQTYDSEQRFGRGIRGVVGKIWREEGWRGFYRGLGTNVVRVLPATWVTFLVYENMRFYLPLWDGKART